MVCFALVWCNGSLVELILCFFGMDRWSSLPLIVKYDMMFVLSVKCSSTSFLSIQVLLSHEFIFECYLHACNGGTVPFTGKRQSKCKPVVFF